MPRKYPYTLTEGIGISWGGGGGGRFVIPKNLKLYWNLLRGGVGGVGKNPFRGGGMDIFWNYALDLRLMPGYQIEEEEGHTVVF